MRGVDGVALATGSVLDEVNTKVLTPEGESVNSEGFPTLGFGIDTSPALDRFNPLNLFEGRWPTADDEVVIDAGTADEQGYAVGDTVEISTLQPKRGFEVVGVAKYGEVDSLGAISFVVFTIPAAQKLLGREGQFDAISVAGDDGLSEDDLVTAIQPVLPGDVEVVSASEEAQEQADEVSDFTSIFRYFLLAFGAIALFVGAFVIFNTFSITVAQRTREFATLRTLGASRRQVLVSVILESLVIGLLASLVGLGLGVVLAEGIEALFGSLGVDLPSADRVFATRTIVVSLAVGVGITFLAGLFPAIRATRVPPISAVREGATLPHSRFAPYAPWIAGVVVVGSLLLLARAMFTDELGTGDRLLSIAGGVLLLFLGVAMLSSHLVTPIAALVGTPARRAGGAAGRLASGNSVRNPGRTAATAAALMIGIALVSFIATLTNGMKASNREAIEEQVRADYVVTSTDGYTPFVAAAGDALAALARARGGHERPLGRRARRRRTTEVGGIEPDTIADAYVFDWKDGDDGVLATLGMDKAIVSANYAEDHDLSVGDTITLRSTADRSARVRVAGTFDPPPFYPLIESVNVSTAAVRLALRPAAQPLDVGERARRAERREPRAARAGDRGVPRHAARDPRGVDRARGRRLQRVHLVPLRDAHARRLRERLRDDQHARPLRLRAHARDRDAARDRDDAAPGPTDDPAGEHHHRAHRRRDRAAARHLPRRAREPRAVGVRRALLHPVGPARRAHDRRDRDRHPRRDHARAPRGEAEPPRSDRLRVVLRWTGNLAAWDALPSVVC